mgnify:CR=1 FL=1
MTGVKKARGKTYDASALNVDDSEECDQPTLAAEDLGEEEMLEVLLQEGDEDAALVMDFDSKLQQQNCCRMMKIFLLPIWHALMPEGA